MVDFSATVAAELALPDLSEGPVKQKQPEEAHVDA